VLKIELCIGCGVCASTCPFEAIRVEDNRNRRILFYPEKCGNCNFECNESCPTKALQGLPSKEILEFEFAQCAVCGKKLQYPSKEAEYLAKKLMKIGESAELAFLCDECKRDRLSLASNHYKGYML